MKTTKPKSVTIDIDGAKMRVLLRSFAGNDAQTVFLLHGLGGSSATWERSANGLCARFRVAVPDLRGCGASERGKGKYTVDGTATDVIAIADAIGLERFAVVGHSFGGVVAQSLLVHHADRISAAVLVSTSSRVNEKAEAGWLKVADIIERKGISQDPASHGRGFTKQFAETNPAEVRHHVQIAMQANASVYAEQARAASRYDYTKALGEVEQPVLVLQGLSDRLTSPGGSVLLDRALKNSRLEMIEGYGHNLPMEMGNAFVLLVSEFLAGSS